MHHFGAGRNPIYLGQPLKINEANQARLPLLAALKTFLVMPHIHQGSDHPLDLTVRLRPVDTSKLLADAISLTDLDKLVVIGSSILLTVVRIAVLNLMRAFIHHLLQKMGRTVLGSIRQNSGV